MVRPAEVRIQNYQHAVDPDVIRTKIANRKDAMIAQQQARQAEIAKIQADISDLLNQLGVPSEFRMSFIKIAMSIYGLTRKFGGAALEKEVKLELDYHYSKYKDVLNANMLTSVLTAIANYFGFSWSPPTTG